jgi:hypothetical protein
MRLKFWMPLALQPASVRIASEQAEGTAGTLPNQAAVPACATGSRE